MSRFGYKSGGTRSLRSVTILFNISTLPSILSKNPNFVNMFKLVVIACALAVASAAPQLLFRSAVIDNEGAKQVGLPYANGWTGKLHSFALFLDNIATILILTSFSRRTKQRSWRSPSCPLSCSHLRRCPHCPPLSSCPLFRRPCRSCRSSPLHLVNYSSQIISNHFLTQKDFPSQIGNQ